MNNEYDTNSLQNLDLIIGNALRKQIFSACSLGFYKYENGINFKKCFNYGKTGIGEGKSIVCEETFYDLASLTKPLVTSLAILLLVDKGIITFEDKLSKFFRGIASDKKEIRLFHLLTHTSGLPAHKPYFKELEKLSSDSRWDYVLNSILSEKLDCYPGKKCNYSDLGFILLGSVIELVAGEKLDIFWEKNILQPMKIENKLFFKKIINTEGEIYAETGICPWSKIKLNGQVNDDNCRALGGVTGHAGLFGTILGLLTYVENISLEIQGNGNIFQFSKETVKAFLESQRNTSWINGFDTPSASCSSSGELFSDMSFGHLGFTGTSFWMDIKKSCGVVMLTNRVLCGEDLAPIKKLRPLIHNLIMSYLKNKVII